MTRDDESCIRDLLDDPIVQAQLPPDVIETAEVYDVPAAVTAEPCRGDGSSVDLALDEAGTAVGWISWNANDPQAGVWEISVSLLASHRAQGLGRRAVALAIDALRSSQSDITVIEAHIRPGNTRSVSLFTSLGFRKKGTHHAYADFDRYVLGEVDPGLAAEATAVRADQGDRAQMRRVHDDMGAITAPRPSD